MSDSTNDLTNTLSTGLGTVSNNNTYDYINNLFLNPSVIIILAIVLILYVILFIFVGNNVSSNNEVVSNSGSKTITVILVVLFIILIIINGLQYIFGINIIAKLKNFLTNSPEIDITVARADAIKAPVSEILIRPQVFNIPENNYIYQDAKALCSAYGSRLATYDEIEKAYNDGGEWCNYGWSEGQMALFPTQKKTFEELQQIKGHENDCGRPGINGGYMVNPKLKFGVNCYGYKPRMNSTEEELMTKEPIYPKTLKDIAMENRINYWKDKLSEILVSPFNHNSWSRL